MKLKTYTAESMAQALAKVRADLGAQAVIVHTRSYQKGAWFGIGGKPVVEITASSERDSVAPKRGFDAPDRRREEPRDDRAALLGALSEVIASRPERERAADEPRVRTRPEHDAGLIEDAPGMGEPERSSDPFEFAHGLSEPGASFLAERSNGDQPSDQVTDDAAFVTIDPEAPAFPEDPEVSEHGSPERVDTFRVERPDPAPSSETPALPERAPGPIWSIETPERDSSLLDREIGKREPEADESDAALRRKIESLEKMMSQVLDSTRRTDHAISGSATLGVQRDTDTPLGRAHEAMLDNEVPIAIADDVASIVSRELDPDESGDEGVVRHAVLRALESRTSVFESVAGAGALPQGRPGVIALIGPTGVGKTTTIAKLAARAKLRAGRRVALITSDTYRIGAVEQLKTYAEIVGLELGVANSPEEMREQLDRFRSMDLVVVDTAGRSQHNGTRLDELRALLDAAAPDETHLVLSSTVTPKVLGSIADRFKALGADACVLTKLDECVTSGVLATIGKRVGLPLSFMTVGQEVPDDLVVARPSRIARCVLDGPGAALSAMKERDQS